MPWNVGINSKTGECCGCDAPPCEDCGKEEPPPPCNCPFPLYDSKTSCDAAAEKISGGSLCGSKCVFAGPCDPSKVTSHGCYQIVDPACEDNGCSFCDGKTEDDFCYKEKPCARCPTITTETGDINCCQEEPKPCKDFGYLNFSEASSKCTFVPECLIDESSNVCFVTGDCYSCAPCSNFGYVDNPSSCPAGTTAQPITKCGQSCYRCVPNFCDCNTVKGYSNSPPFNPDPECTVVASKTGVLLSPCESKLCYYLRCSDCGDKGYLTEIPNPPDECFDYPEKPICFGWQFDSYGDECDSEICYDKVERKCKDFTQDGTGDQCASGEDDCVGDTFFDDSTGGCLGGDCPTLDCPGVCKEYCGWKVTGVSFEPDGSPSCQTTANLNIINGNCTSGSASSVATQNISGLFIVVCPPGDPCEGKVPSTSWPPSPGIGSSSPVTFSWEDCGISPADGVVTVTLERCKDGCS